MFFPSFIRHFSHHHWQLLCRIYHKILPPTCLLCGSLTLSSQNLCVYCQKNLPILSHKCLKCAQILSFSGAVSSHICGNCLKNPPPFDLTHTLFPYQTPISSLIIALKFKHDLSCAQVLGELMAEKIQTEWYQNKQLPDLIIPIPLHPKRLCERGFNQALEIARPIAKQLAIPIDITSVKRIKDTVPQSGLLAAQRKKNMAGAFIANGYYKNRCIAVIDDVITTSHTVTEFCKILKRVGAKTIHVWCCARR